MAVLELDFAAPDADEVAPPLEPVIDNFGVRNDITVDRREGSSARAVDEDGPLGVNTIGRVKGTVNVNTASDDDLPNQAAWHLILGTVEGARYPHVTVDLDAAPPALVTAASAVGLGDLIRLVNLPDDLDPTLAELIILGYSQSAPSHRRLIVFNTTPAKIYQQIGIWGTSRWDTVVSQLKTAVNSTATSFDVAVTSGPLWTADNAQDGFDWHIGGERVTVTDIAPSTITFGAVGAVDHAVNAQVTPGLPLGLVTGNLIVCLAAIRNSGSGVPNTPSGWTRLAVFATNSNVQLFAKIAGSSESAPSITFSGSVAGADTSAQIIRLVGKWHSASSILIGAASCLNASAQNITYPGLPLPSADNAIILYVGWKQDDWTSVATVAGATEIGEPDTITGDDQGIVWDRVIQTTAAAIPSGVFTVSGGVSAISRGAVVALRCDYQTATVTRSVNGVVKSQIAGEAINLWTPMRWGL